MFRKCLLLVPVAALLWAAPVAAQTEHCPDHQGHPGKVEGKHNDVVLAAGTVFCVKGSTDATGELAADGETALVDYLGNGHDVSYYVVYEEVPPSTTTTTQPPTITTQPPTTTTSGPVIPTTTTTAPTVLPSSTTTTSGPSRIIITTPHLGCVTPDGFPYVTNIEQGGCLTAQTPTATVPVTTSELPRTGWDAGLLFVIGTAVLLAGLSCWFAGKAIE